MPFFVNENCNESSVDVKNFLSKIDSNDVSFSVCVKGVESDVNVIWFDMLVSFEFLKRLKFMFSLVCNIVYRRRKHQQY